MKFPVRNTCGYAICKLLHKNGLTHAIKVVSELSLRFVSDTVTENISALEAGGLIVRADWKIDLSVPARRHFDQLEVDVAIVTVDNTRSVATPRSVPPFKPLTGYKLPKDGLREGAADHRNWKSRHL